jgi:hypothetical protein
MRDPASRALFRGSMFGWTNTRTGSAMHIITFDTEPALSDPSLQGVTWGR